MIRFAHPISGKELEVRAPQPPDFKAMIAALRIAAEAIANPGKRGR
jgi:hypothetical protein